MTRPLLINGARIVDPSRDLDAVGAVLVSDGLIAAAGPEALNQGTPEGAEIVEGDGLTVIPGLVDIGVFVGEPGAEHRETIASASEAAAAGGVTTIVLMPDTNPVIDDPSLVDYLIRRARDTALVNVHVLAALTRGLKGVELSEIGLLLEAGAIGFTQARTAVASPLVLRNALSYARDFDALVANPVQCPELSADGVMNAGETATRLGLGGIPREAETIILERDLRLSALTGSRYHALCLSCHQSLDALRSARTRGHAITVGTSIAHLSLNENDVGPYRTFFKLSPPLRSEDDRQAVIEALSDGTIDVVMSAHDPRGTEGKRQPFQDAAIGAVGLETLLAAGLRLVHDGSVPLARLVAATSTNPARLLGIQAGTLKPGAPADLALVDIGRPWVVAIERLRSRSRNTAFEGATLSGMVTRTLVRGRTVYACE